MFADQRQAVADAQMEAFGDPGVFTPSDGSPVDVSVIFHPQTVVAGELGPVVDERASAELLVSQVGLRPSGVLRLHGRTFELERPVKGTGARPRAHHWLREVSA